jgi:hypothetical protein
LSKTIFAYHRTHVFGPFGLESYYTDSEKPNQGDLVYVISGDKEPDSPRVDYFLEGIFQIRLRDPGSWTLKSSQGEKRSFKYRLSMVSVRVPDAPVMLAKAPWYSREEMHRYFSSAQSFNPLPTDPPYKSRFDEQLAGHASNTETRLIEDLAALERDIPNETERDVLAKARVGQGRFRTDLVAAWGRGEMCALTGVAVPELLIASHIKPWREATNAERLDPMNGLLLVAHADKLFDRHLLSFARDREGFVAVLHPRVLKAMRDFGIRAGKRLDTTMLNLGLERRLEGYLSMHHARHLEIVARDSPTT